MLLYRVDLVPCLLCLNVLQGLPLPAGWRLLFSAWLPAVLAPHCDLSLVFRSNLTACSGLLKYLTLCPKHHIVSFFHAFNTYWNSCLPFSALLSQPGKITGTFQDVLGKFFWFLFFPLLLSQSLLYVLTLPWGNLCVYILYCAWLLTCLSFSLDLRDLNFFLLISTILGSGRHAENGCWVNR